MLAINDPASPLTTLPTRPPTNQMGIAACPTTYPIEDPPKLPTLELCDHSPKLIV